MAQPKLIKSVPGAKLYEDDKGGPLLRLDNMRGSYLFVGTPADDKDDNGNPSPKWRGVGMLPKERTEVYELVVATIEKLISQQGKGDKAVKVPRATWFIQDGDEKEDPAMHGHWLISASDAKIRPTARDRTGQVIQDPKEVDKMFYGGCWLTMVIRPWYFGGTVKGNPKTFPKRISASLASVFFMKDDKPFGSGRIDDSSMYDDIEASGDDGLGNSNPNHDDGDEI